MTVGGDFIGIGMELVATFLSALGYTLQKLAHMDVDAGRANGLPYQKLLKFRLGLLSLIAGSALAVAAFGLLDQSKQSPMAACTLIYNGILASRFLGESFTLVDFISSTLMAGGTIMAVLFSDKTSEKFTFEKIVHRVHDDLVIIYTPVLAVILIGMSAFVEYNVRKIAREDWGVARGRLINFCCAFVAGFLAGFTAYFAKAVVSIFYARDWVAFANPLLYVYIAFLVLSVFNQLRYLNMGLRFFDSLQMIPLYESFIVFSGMISGIVYYGDMRTATAGRFAGFIMGGFVTCAGIMLLVWKKKGRTEETQIRARVGSKHDQELGVPKDEHGSASHHVPLLSDHAASDAGEGSSPDSEETRGLLLHDDDDEEARKARSAGGGGGGGGGGGRGGRGVGSGPLVSASLNDASVSGLVVHPRSGGAGGGGRGGASGPLVAPTDGAVEVQVAPRSGVLLPSEAVV